jgi:bifunctional non-homologous end joining protein LigD
MMINPMLAKASTPFDSPDWLFEIKWDGERIIAFVEGEKIIRLQNRHGNDVTKRYPEIIGSHIAANEVILDGEMIVFGEDHKPSFSKLAQRSHLEDGLKIDLLSRHSPAVYIPFDVIRYHGTMIDRTPLIKRKDILSSITSKENGSIGLSFYVEGNGQAFFDTIVNMGYEGIMAKKKNSYYLLEKRSELWLKMKPRKSAICHIVGFKKGNGHRERLGALLIEEKVDGVFKDRGWVGSGISDQDLSALINSLRPLCESKDGKIIFVESTIKIEVNYFEETEAGHFRFPVFKAIVK